MRFKIITFLMFVTFYFSCFAQTQWFFQNSGTSSILQDVYFVDQNYGWAAGANIILNTTDGGQTWNQQSAPPVSLFYISIYFVDRLNGWACGNDAKIIHTSDGGNNWAAQSNPYSNNNPILYGIYFVNKDTGWAVGGDHGIYPNFINHRVILYTTNGGVTWDYQYYFANQKPLYCIYFSSASDGFTASEYGNIMHTSDGGINWEEKTQISVYQIFGLYFNDPETGWAVGEYLGVPHVSSISKTTDGGSTWDTQTFGTDEYLRGVSFVDENNGWAVGGTIGGSGGNQHSTILHTTDAGNNWELQNAPTSYTLLGVNFPDAGNGWAVGINGVLLKGENPVPVELISFTAKSYGKAVVLTWKTATETNNSGFEVQRMKADDRSQKSEWKDIRFIEGHGTTTLANNYSFTDNNVPTGSYLYRLKQIDFDGTTNESKIIDVNVFVKPTKYSLKQNYPNPFNPSTIIKYSIPNEGKVKLEVFNSIGQKIKTLVNEYMQPGVFQAKFNAEKLSSGVYYYRIVTTDFISTKKMILLK